MKPAGVPWPGWPHAPAPLRSIHRARRRDRQVPVVDDAGRTVAFGPLVAAYELCRLLWLFVLDALLATIVRATVRRGTALSPADGRNTGPVVLVLPVLPDLSHTFVYREVLAILQQRPDWRVVVLAHNEAAPVHAEARLLLAAATFLPRDGITRRTLRACRWLSTRRGRQLFGLYRAAPGGSARDLLGKNPLRDARHPGNAFLLADLLRRCRPRAVHVYGSTYPANVALGAAHLLAAPLSISSYVDFEFDYAHKMLATKLSQARFFRVVTACCQARLMAMPGLPALVQERVPVVYLGLDLANWRDEAPLTGQRVLVSAARLVAKKGLQFVPPALAALHRRGVRCRWRVIGDGPGLAALQASCVQHGVADHVVFLGPQDNTTVRRELLAADAAVLPCVIADDGERDGIPIFLIEAMALGVPAITTPISGIPELVVDGDTGFFAAPGDSDSLAAVIDRVLADRELAHAVGRRGREAVHRQLDVAHSAALLIAHIEA